MFVKIYFWYYEIQNPISTKLMIQKYIAELFSLSIYWTRTCLTLNQANLTINGHVFPKKQYFALDSTTG